MYDDSEPKHLLTEALVVVFAEKDIELHVVQALGHRDADCCFVGAPMRPSIHFHVHGNYVIDRMQNDRTIQYDLGDPEFKPEEFIKKIRSTE